MNRFAICVCLALGLLLPESSFGQVAVQQPVVQGFSTSTTVSIPDRGSALLGGVGRGAMTRRTTGPLRSGSNLGVETSNSSSSASVYIHDFQAMDAALLAEGASRVAENDPFGRLQSRAEAMTRAGSMGAAPAKVPEVSLAERQRKFERLAQDAETRGKWTVARLHWEMAAKVGSPLAREGLQRVASRR